MFDLQRLPLSKLFRDKVVREGNATLFCNASGIPEPRVSWINVRTDQRSPGDELAFENIYSMSARWI